MCVWGPGNLDDDDDNDEVCAGSKNDRIEMKMAFREWCRRGSRMRCVRLASSCCYFAARRTEEKGGFETMVERKDDSRSVVLWFDESVAKKKQTKSNHNVCRNPCIMGAARSNTAKHRTAQHTVT